MEALWDSSLAYSNRCNPRLLRVQIKRHLTSQFSSRSSKCSSSHLPCKVKEALLQSSRQWVRRPKASQVASRIYSCSLVSNLMVANLQACKVSWAIRMLNKSLSTNSIFSQLSQISGKLHSKLNNQEQSHLRSASLAKTQWTLSSSNSLDSKTSASCSTKPSQTVESAYLSQELTKHKT